jgi:ABC-type sugar transport system substrate-binding protein
MRKIHKWLGSVMLAGAIALGGCSKSESTSGTSTTGPSASRQGDITVFLLPKKKSVPYFESCAAGANEAAQSLGGIDLTYDGPTSGSADEAAKMIEQWTLQGANVIAVSASNPAVLAPVMKSARDKGVHVITWDADTPPDSREFFVCQASSEQIGNALTDTLAKDIGAGNADKADGEVAIVTAQMTAANQNEWIKYIKERLAKYPELKLVDIQPSDDDQTKAQQITQDLIKAHPNLKGIFAISSQAFPGTAEAIKQAGKVGQIQVTGLSTPNDMKKYVNDGTVKSVVLWNTKDLGYLTICVAKAVADGTLKKGATTFNAGRLGEKKVEGDTVLLGGILVFNKDSINQYDF